MGNDLLKELRLRKLHLCEKNVNFSSLPGCQMYEPERDWQERERDNCWVMVAGVISFLK